MTVKARLNREQIFQEEVLIKIWEQINRFGHPFSKKVAVKEVVHKICLVHQLVPHSILH